MVFIFPLSAAYTPSVMKLKRILALCLLLLFLPGCGVSVPTAADSTVYMALTFITREDVANKLFKTIAPEYAERNGGYTRIVRTGVRRGDAAETAIIELVK